MTTEEHLTAVEDAIRAAGGPDRVRFCPVSIELVEQAKVSRPVTAEIQARDSGLVDIILTELETP
jgi:hypothetical protein